MIKDDESGRQRLYIFISANQRNGAEARTALRKLVSTWLHQAKPADRHAIGFSLRYE